jgi:putative DNA-binding protein
VPDLRELQAAFWRSLTSGTAEASLLGRIRSTPALRADERFEIYARMYRDRVVDALREDFPRVAAILGDDRFKALAASYLATHPSAHPSLRHVGRELPNFIARSVTAGLPAFLADLARLEWARGDAFDAPDVEPLGLDDLRAVSPEDWGGLRFALVPAATVLVADWPVHEIWEAGEGAVLARRTAVRVWRKGFAVYHAAMDGPEETALRHVRAGEPFATICEVLETPDEAAGLLLRWVEDGLITRHRP